MDIQKAILRGLRIEHNGKKLTVNSHWFHACGREFYDVHRKDKIICEKKHIRVAIDHLMNNDL